MTSKQVTLPPWNSRKLVHSKEMVWAWRWSVALRTFYRQILSLLYEFFSSETSAPGSPGNYLYLYAFIKGKHHNHQNHPISEKVPGSIPRRSPLAVLCLLLLGVWFLLLFAVAVVAVVPVVAVVALVVAVAALVALAAAFGGASGAAAMKWYGCRCISACWD